MRKFSKIIIIIFTLVIVLALTDSSKRNQTNRGKLNQNNDIIKTLSTSNPKTFI